MTHDELLAKIIRTEYYKEKQLNNVTISVGAYSNENANSKALRAVVELHKPHSGLNGNTCTCDPYDEYSMGYPCPTIQAIEKELG